MTDVLPNGTESTAANKANNFVIDAANSVVNCSPNGNNMNCNEDWESIDDDTTGVKTSFVRNWKTGDEPGQDDEISWDTAGSARHLFGFVNQF